MPETLSNIDAFNAAAAFVFDALYGAFPDERLVGAADLGPAADPAVSERLPATIEWLLAEGFVRGRKIADGPAPFRLSLTAKGLAVLSATPDAVQVKEPLGKRLGTALRSGGREAVNALITQVVTAAATGRLPGV